MPPLWTFGFLQSRWGWKDRADIEETLKQYRTLHIPVDAFIFDFEWYTTKPDYRLAADGTPEFNDFGWNPALFPQPAEQISNYRHEDIHVIGIRKPRLGNSDHIKMFGEKGWLRKGKGNEDGYHQRDIDYANPEVAKPLVSDERWAEVGPLLPPVPPRPRGGRPRIPDRAVLTGIVFVLRTGTPWELLPPEMGCGSGMTCWRRLRDCLGRNHRKPNAPRVTHKRTPPRLSQF